MRRNADRAHACLFDKIRHVLVYYDSISEETPLSAATKDVVHGARRIGENPWLVSRLYVTE